MKNQTQYIKLPFYRLLYFQVLLAIIIGALLGHFYSSLAIMMKPLADIFIQIIKILVVPIIFCTISLGIAGMSNMKKIGQTAGLALLYFEVVSTLALVFGLVGINVLHPGQGMNLDLHNVSSTSLNTYITAKSFTIPSTLPTILLAILCGCLVHYYGGATTRIYQLMEKAAKVLFGIIDVLMKFAPLAAFGAMAFTVGQHGISSLIFLVKFMGTFYLVCLLFIVFILGFIARLHQFSLWKLIRFIRAELLIVLGTSSSESVLPRMMEKLEQLGINKTCVGLVLPTGYSFNLDGTAIYLTLAAVFIAQATNTPLSLWQQLSLLGILLITSKGAAGVTGSGFIILAATLPLVGHIPLAGLALILSIDRFMSEARALTNLIGNCVATLVVARWTKEINLQQLHQTLNGRGITS